MNFSFAVPFFLLLSTAAVVDAANYQSSYYFNNAYSGNGQQQQQGQQQQDQQAYGQMQATNCISFRVQPASGSGSYNGNYNYGSSSSSNNNNGGGGGAATVETFGLPHVSEESYMFYKYSGGDSFDSTATWMVDLKEWAPALGSVASGDGNNGATISGCQAIQKSAEVLDGTLDELLATYKESLMRDDSTLFQVDASGQAFGSQQARQQYIESYLSGYAQNGIQLYWGPICKRSSWGVTQGVFLDKDCTVYVPYLESVVQSYIQRGEDQELVAYNQMAKTVLNSAYSQPVSCQPTNGNANANNGNSNNYVNSNGYANYNYNQYTNYANANAGASDPYYDSNGLELNTFCSAVVQGSVNIDSCEPMDPNYSSGGAANGGGYNGAYGAAQGGYQGADGASYHISQNDLSYLPSTCYAVENALANGMPSLWDQLGVMESAYETANASQSSAPAGLTATAIVVGIVIGAALLAIGLGMALLSGIRSRKNAEMKGDDTIKDDDSDTSKKEPLVSSENKARSTKRDLDSVEV
jgi:hypothetical protein